MNDGARVLLNVTELPRLADAPARHKAWVEIVRGVAALAAPDTPAPLESLDPAALAAAVLAAKEAGALDAPTPLPAELESRALYEIASALPSGPARACVGPLVDRWLYKGRSDVFLSVARRIALTAPAELRGEAVRARLALSCAIPPRLGTAAEDLALALLAREESARNWIEIPSMGPLPQRRLAGRLLGRAARAHARGRGGAWAARLVAGETVAMVLARLLADREPLVWRHAAIARGLLSASDGRFWRAICDGLSPSMSPTEWRRAAASLASSAARAPDRAMALLDDLLATEICDRDPGTATAAVWGIAAAAERQPEAADAMLAKLVDKAPLAVAEGLGDVLALGPGGDFGLRAFERSREALSIAHQRVTGDEGVRALLGKLLEELSPGGEPAVDGALRRALRAYRDEGADAAHLLGREALALMESHVETLEPLHGSGDDEAAAAVRRRAFSVLRDIERGMLQDGTLADLLSIGVPDEAARRALVSLGAAQDRVASWVLRREQEEVAHPPGRASTPPGRRGHTALRLHQIRALLHVADAPIPGEVPGAASRIRALRKRIASLTRDKLAAHPPAALHRALCATLARALDALVRTGDLDEDDVVLVLARAELTAADARTIAEASMNPHLEAIVAAFAALLPGDGDEAPASIPATRRHPSFPAPEEVQRPLSGPAQVRVAALVDFSRRLREPPPSRAPQIASLRSTLVSLSSSLGALLSASSLEHVVDTGEASPPLLTLEAALTELSRRASIADRRLGKESVALAREPELHQRVADAVDKLHAGHASMALTAADREASQALPPAFARVVSDVLTFLQGLPLTLPGERRPRAKALPAWLPSDRIVGGFYVVAPVGEGGAGTVFQVRRLADKDDPAAERFALKMPVFQGSSATMTEAQFLQMFRDEASALLGLPHHENLARFVTFDLSARPRPILVMELVDGASLEEMLVPAGLSTARALELTLGVLAGLSAMHEVGIAHLDVKPSNVILRGGEVPVLVDFGLAGRHIRPGCGSVAYGAPEVWVGGEGAKKLSPLPTDAYAAACLVFEVLGATPLFAGSEIAAIAMHVGHDGWPPALVGWRDVAALRPLAELLASALRKEPADRVGTKKLHDGLSRLAPSLRDLPWPLGPA